MNTKIEELLHDELSSQVDGVHLSGDVFAAALRRYRRRRMITASVAGAAAVTAGALLATSVVGGSTAAPRRGAVPGSQPQATVATHPALLTVAYVRRHILQAVDPAHAIVRFTWTGDGQTNDNWLDQDTGYNTDYIYEGGVLSGAVRGPLTKAGDSTTISYIGRTYYVSHQDAVPPAPVPTSGKLGEPWLDSVADIKAAIRRADVHILGHGTFEGRPATHVRFTFRAGGETIRGDAWFDSQTYAPLRATTTYQEAPEPTGSGPHADGSAGAGTAAPGPTTGTTSFLPRTAANLAKTRLAIPDGFRKITLPSK